jgi:hypothetical protein
MAWESVMGIFSWFGSRKARGRHSRPRSLVRSRYETPKLKKIEEGAAADVAVVEEDGRKFSGPDTPANQKDEL